MLVESLRERLCLRQIGRLGVTFPNGRLWLNNHISQIQNFFQEERESIISKFNEAKEIISKERAESENLRKKIRQMQQ